MAPATGSPGRPIGKPGAEGLPSPGALAASQPALPCEAADNSSEHSSSDVAMPGEVLPRAHSSYRTSGGLAAPLPGQPHHPHVGLEDQEPLRITVDAKERLRWSPALHQRFCQAVAELGGSALAKPKDIVAKMRVVGLTLAHVKSHLQKYRLSEGVTCVPHSSARGHAASLRRMQQQLAPLPPMGLSAGSMDTELGAPAAKRARSSPTTLPSPALMAASSGVWPPLPALPSGAEALPAFLSGLGPSDAGMPVLLPQPVGLPLPPLPLPSMPAPAASAPAQPEQPEGLEKLLELAELAAAQHDELHSLELGASSDELDSLGQQLAASAALPPQQDQEQQQPGGCPPEMAARVAALQGQQAQLKAALAAHAQQHARLAEQLADFRRSVAELLSGVPQQMLTPAQLQQVQQVQLQQDAAAQPAVKSEPAAEQEQPAAQPHPAALNDRAAVASAVLHAVAQQPTAAGGALSGPAAAEAAAGSSPHIASLIALIASAANSGAGPAPAHLQQLMQHASLMSGAQPLA